MIGVISVSWLNSDWHRVYFSYFSSYICPISLEGSVTCILSLPHCGFHYSLKNYKTERNYLSLTICLNPSTAFLRAFSLKSSLLTGSDPTPASFISCSYCPLRPAARAVTPTFWFPQTDRVCLPCRTFILASPPLNACESTEWTCSQIVTRLAP